MELEKLRKKWGQGKSALVLFLLIILAVFFFFLVMPVLKIIFCDDNIVSFICWCFVFIPIYYGFKDGAFYENLFKLKMTSLVFIIITISFFFLFFKNSIIGFFKQKYVTRC